MFYVAQGHVNKPWLCLEAFHLYVTLGPLLHHEKNFSFFRARTIVYEGDQWFSPFITIILPHYLEFPIWFPSELRDLCTFSDRAELKDLCLPMVEILPRVNPTWRRDVVTMGPSTEIQMAMISRLEQSWAKNTRRVGKRSDF